MNEGATTIPIATVFLLHMAVWLICIAGIAASCLSFTGTWLISIAAVIAAWLSGPGFPGWITVAALLLLSAATEVIETLAAHWGVTSRGGSRAAGVAAVAGGLLGMVLGSFLPVPVAGPLLGICIGSFALAYMVERRRERTHGEAANVALGALLARVAVLVFKTAASVIAATALLGGFYFDLLR